MSRMKEPVCCIYGEDDGALVFKPRLVDNKNRRLPEPVVDIRTADGIYVATGVPMRQMAKLDEFITAVYDWRRKQLMPGMRP